MALSRYLERIRACHTIDEHAFVPWFVRDDAGVREAGRVHRVRVVHLRAPGAPFHERAGRLELAGADFAARSDAIAAFGARLAAAGDARPALHEAYPVRTPTDGEPLLQLDRALVPWFGVRAWGVHCNGFVRASPPALWLARRARGKRTFPGHLDKLVAGGQSIGLDPRTTLRKEAHEEAGLGPELVARAVAANDLHYVHQDGLDRKADTLQCFDLELPADCVPRPVDGEVEGFELRPFAAVAASLRSADAWKPNCALVAIDFLLRHGALHDELGAAGCERLRRALAGEAA
jgi:8-oxo-dGTP pyrophosphatase MutT (NUDIX family)